MKYKKSVVNGIGTAGMLLVIAGCSSSTGVTTSSVSGPNDQELPANDDTQSQSVLNRDNARQVLASVLDVYRGALLDQRWSAWVEARDSFGEATGEVDDSGSSLIRYACVNGGTADHRGWGTGSRDGIAHSFVYTDCLLGEVEFSGKAGWFAGAELNNYTPDLVMSYPDGSTIDIKGSLKQHRASPSFDQYHLVQLGISDYRFRSASGTELSIQASSEYVELSEFSDNVVSRTMSGDVTLISEVSGQKTVVARVVEDLVSNTTESFSGFDQGMLVVTAEDGGVLTLDASREVWLDQFRVTLSGAAGDEVWLENWSDWLEHLTIVEKL